MLHMQKVCERSSNNYEEHSCLKHWEPKTWKLVHQSELDGAVVSKIFFSYKCSEDQVLENVAILRSIYTIELYNPTSVKRIRYTYVLFSHPYIFVFSY